MTAIARSADLDRRGRVALLTVGNPPVNALSQHVRQGLREGVKQAIADPVIYGYGRRVYRGGPVFWADQIGLRQVRDRMLEFQKATGDAFLGAGATATGSSTTPSFSVVWPRRGRPSTRDVGCGWKTCRHSGRSNYCFQPAGYAGG